MEYSETRAWAFLQAAPGYRDPAELEAHFGQALEAFGFDRYVCSRIDGRKSTFDKPIVLASKGTMAWDERIHEQGYMAVDPCKAWGDAGRPVFAWSDAREWAERKAPAPAKAKEMWDDASSIGMNNGLVVTAAGPAGQVLLTRMMTEARRISDHDRAILDCIAVIFSTMRLRLYEQAHDRPLNGVLTRREAECLRWAGQGLSDVDIAERLGRSIKTVNFHIENAKRKLGAPTRLAAYHRAMEFNLLT